MSAAFNGAGTVHWTLLESNYAHKPFFYFQKDYVLVATHLVMAMANVISQLDNVYVRLVGMDLTVQVRKFDFK